MNQVLSGHMPVPFTMKFTFNVDKSGPYTRCSSNNLVYSNFCTVTYEGYFVVEGINMWNTVYQFQFGVLLHTLPFFKLPSLLTFFGSKPFLSFWVFYFYILISFLFFFIYMDVSYYQYICYYLFIYYICLIYLMLWLFFYFLFAGTASMLYFYMCYDFIITIL